MKIELDTQAGPIIWDTDKADERTHDLDAFHMLVEAATDAVVTWPDEVDREKNDVAMRKLAWVLGETHGVQLPAEARSA